MHVSHPAKKNVRTHDKILALLRGRDYTVNELAASLSLTNNAVRAQLDGMQKETLVGVAGVLAGVRKPHVLYRLTENAAHALPNAYGLLLRHTIDALVDRMGPRRSKGFLRLIGRYIARQETKNVAAASPRARRKIALDLFRRLGGDATFTTLNGEEVFQGCACPLAAVTAQNPEACAVGEALLSEILGQPVKECCSRGERPRCLFKILSR